MNGIVEIPEPNEWASTLTYFKGGIIEVGHAIVTACQRLHFIFLENISVFIAFVFFI